MRILGFGTYDTTRHPRVGIVLDGLRGTGDEVVEANSPLGLSTNERVAMLGRPWSAHRLVRRLLARWWTVSRRARRAGRDGPFDAIIVGYLGHFDVVLARLLFPRGTIALDLLIFAADTARDRGISSAPKLKALRSLDWLAARCADVIMLDTVEHRELLSPSQRAKAVVVPVGASAAWFSAGEVDHDRTPGEPLRVVFFGLFTPLQGAVVIGEALSRLAGCSDIVTTMIGVGQDRDLTRAAAAGNDGVTWLDWVAADALATLVAAHDVCLGIFGTTPKAQRVVPNKVFQGAAAGCAIITSDTAPQRRALGDAALLVPGGDPRALADALRLVASDRPQLRMLRQTARGRSRASFRPETIARPLRASLQLARRDRRSGRQFA